MTTEKTESTDKTAPLCMIYGDSGMGKTTDCGYSFPNALFIAAPNALASIENVCGYAPAQVDAKDITEATQKIEAFLNRGGSYDAIVVDDLSFLHEQEIAKWEQKNKTNAFFKFQKANDAMLSFRNLARYAGLAVIVNCWQRHPGSSGSVFKKGGPKLTGSLGEAVPNMFDVVLRAGSEPTRKPWTGVYQCTNDLNWIMKDRFNIAATLKNAPMNLAEILRASGHQISRLKGLEWQEDVVNGFTTQFLSADPSETYKIANDFYSQLLSKSIDHRIAAWTVRDSLDRTVIKRGLDASRSTFF